MAYTGILCTEAEIAAQAGENVDATGATEANRNDWVAQAEAYICILCRYNFCDNFATLNSDVASIVSEYCARYVAMCEIAFNMAGYTSRLEAENMVNIHLFRMQKIEELLKDQKNITWVHGGAL